MTIPLAESNADHLSGANRFDIAVGGLRLLLPPAMPCEYFAQAIVWPVPRAPRRLFGMMHLRGHGVPVLDVQSQTTDLLPIVQRCPLIVLREGAAAVALLCDRPPSLVTVGASLPDAVKPDTPFAPALLGAARVRSEAGEGTAWSFDIVDLIDLAVAAVRIEVV